MQGSLYNFDMLKFIFCLFLIAPAYAADDTNTTPRSFESFLTDIRTQAISQGVSTLTLDQAFEGLTPNPNIIKFDRSQAEFSQNFWRYLNSRVNMYRFANGEKKLATYWVDLQRVHAKYGIAPHVIVAFWGLETNYGNNTGQLNLIRSLATLSFDERRSVFFTKQLLALLKLIDENKIPLNAKGSWAGAMGNVQFMPTNVAKYAVDANGDGKLGLWDNAEDIFASAANFLKNIGWHQGERWGREATIPTDFNYSLANITIKKTLHEWQALGVRTAIGKDLPDSKLKASLILPMGYKGPAFLVYRNFYAILKWNQSILYALSVGHLSDRLAGGGPLIAKPIIEPSLSREKVERIQTMLNQLGFNIGTPDGMSGPKTRDAVRQFQRHNRLPVDGYVGHQLLRQLKRKQVKGTVEETRVKKSIKANW